ncbi:MAG: DUF4147 domain-containing protein, partial [Caulobacterales bacterium]|nr:DUF4147 domain-containing protein [Caulobacterales bacterium]
MNRNVQGLMARADVCEDRGALLRDMFAVATDAASPRRALPSYLPDLSGYDRTFIVAVGKAAASMAEAAFAHYGRPLPGVVLTRYGHGVEAL